MDLHSRNNRWHDLGCLKLKTLLLTIVISLGAAFPSYAQQSSIVPQLSEMTGKTPPTLAELEARKKAVEVNETIDAEIRAKTLAFYGQALEARGRGDELAAQSAGLAEKLKLAPERLKKIEELLSAPASPPDPAKLIPAKASSNQIEALIGEEEARLAAARETAVAQELSLASLLNAPRSFGAEIATITELLARIEQDLSATPPQNGSDALSEARRTALLARRYLRENELAVLLARLSGRNTLTRLATAERDLARAETTMRTATLEVLRATFRQRREQEASQVIKAVEQVKVESTVSPAPVQAIAGQNVRLVEEMAELIRIDGQIGERLQSANNRLESVRAEFESTKKRVELAGRSEATGRLLRRRLAQLLSITGYGRNAAKRRSEIARVIDRQITIDELRLGLSDLDAEADRVVSSISPPPPTSDQPQLRKQIRDLLATQQNALQELFNVFSRYAGHLTDLDRFERELVIQADSHLAYIREQLLWIPNLNPATFNDAAQLLPALRWLLSPTGWSMAASDLVKGVNHSPALLIAGLLGIAGLLVLRQFAVRRIDDSVRNVGQVQTDSLKLTLAALLYTIIRASVVAAPVILSGGLLVLSPGAEPFSLAVGAGLIAAGTAFGIIRFFQYLVQPNAVADRHFRWSGFVLQGLARNLRWFAVVIPPLLFLILVTDISGPNPTMTALGRLAYVAAMLTIAILFWRLLRRTGPVNREVTEQSPNPLSRRRVFLLAPLLTGPPLVLAGFSILGYQYAATILDRRFGATILFFIGFVLLKELLLRWLSIAQRKLHYESALRRRDEARAQRAKEGALATIEESELIAIEKEEINFEDLGEQVKRLLRACFILGGIIGVWMIWADVFPALSVFERVNLPFNTIELVDGVAKEVPVTLLDLGVALSLLVLSVVVAKNLSGVLEIAVLQRLPLDPGVRYAITTLAKYTIVTMGLIAAFGMLGAQWSKLQWLIAALGVGVGFGLQEIVANFICGIILLLERPIRIGDIITLGDTSGVVSKIRIRATTVLNWDNQELIVPNKEFITGRLLNWTLTEKRNRIVLQVGVAYDSDVVLALKLLLKTADENARVLKEPKPLATFDTFGDSTLNLVLRCYLPNLDARLAIMSELRQAILREFEANGIVIAFPQRDVHIDMTGPLGIHMSDSMEKQKDVSG